MKLLNIFKKNTSKAVVSNVQKLEKNQLEKVIGGLELLEPSYQSSTKTKSNVKNNN